jgi:RNA polymerase sigma-70 factor (ECF subfamily)
MSGMAGVFSTTVWSTIQEAKKGRKTAVNQILDKYRAPIVAFLRHRGCSPDDAEDLAQEVFLVVVRDDLLAQADRERGRFRTFLLAIAQNVLSNSVRVRRAAKRGGGTPPLPYDRVRESVSTRDSEDSFDAEWVRNLLRLALDRLRAIDERLHQVLRFREDGDRTHEQVGHALGIPAKQAANLLLAARKKLNHLIRSEIQDYCSSSTEYREEIAYLKRFLGARVKS